MLKFKTTHHYPAPVSRGEREPTRRKRRAVDAEGHEAPEMPVASLFGICQLVVETIFQSGFMRERRHATPRQPPGRRAISDCRRLTMRLFFDTEFVEDGRIIDLISIGMVREDGTELYQINNDENVIERAVAHPWLTANVTPHLPVTVNRDSAPAASSLDGAYPPALSWTWDTDHPDWPNVAPRSLIADRVRDFILATPDVELWAYFGGYDRVALNQLFGTMQDVPAGIPLWGSDLKQEAHRVGARALPEQATGLHNALADSRWCRDAYAYVASLPEAAR